MTRKNSRRKGTYKLDNTYKANFLKLLFEVKWLIGKLDKICCGKLSWCIWLVHRMAGDQEDGLPAVRIAKILWGSWARAQVSTCKQPYVITCDIGVH